MADDITVKDQTEKTKNTAVSYYEAVGRRKNATARVRLYVVKEDAIMISGVSVGKGDMIVNGRPAEKYFPGEVTKKTFSMMGKEFKQLIIQKLE